MAKVQYGLDKLYYAVATIADDGSATYGDPVAMPGATAIALDPQQEKTTFRADNVDFWTTFSNNGYSGTVTFSTGSIPDSFLTDVLGYVKDAKGALVEDVSAEPKHFALLFRFTMDNGVYKENALYNCVIGRPSVSSETTPTGAITPNTSALDITASSVYNASLDKNIVKASLLSTASSTDYASWNTKVYQPTKSKT